MNRVECKHNYGVGCLDPSMCATCGWNPEETRRRLEEQKAALLQEMKPRITYFEKNPAFPEALAEFLGTIRAIKQRNSPAWFLAQEVACDGNDPLR